MIVAKRMSVEACILVNEVFNELRDLLPCEVKQYCVEDIVVMPNGALVNKDYLILEEL